MPAALIVVPPTVRRFDSAFGVQASQSVLGASAQHPHGRGRVAAWGAMLIAFTVRIRCLPRMLNILCSPLICRSGYVQRQIKLPQSILYRFIEGDDLTCPCELI